MSQRVRAVRHSSAQWAAHGRRLRSHSPSAARNGGSHGPSPRRPPQRRPRSGSRFLSKRTSHSIRRLRLHCRNRKRQKRHHRARHHRQRRRRPSRPAQPPQHHRARRARRRLTPPLQLRHQPSLQTMPYSRQVCSTKPSQYGQPRLRLPPLNDATRPGNKGPPRDNCRPGPRLRTTLAGPLGRYRPPTSWGSLRPRHRHPPMSAGWSGAPEPCSAQRIMNPGGASIFHRPSTCCELPQ